MAVILSNNNPADSALAYKLHGDYARWGTTEYLLAAVLDSLNAANWQRSGKSSRKPKPVPRPKDKQSKNLSGASLKKNPMQSGIIGSGADYDSIVSWLSKKNGH